MLSHRMLPLGTVLAACLFIFGAHADGEPLPTHQIKSEIYFGSDMGSGKRVSDDAWSDFLSSVVRSRFPTALTVLEAVGRGAGKAGELTRVRVVIIIHASGVDADMGMSIIKSEYKRRFSTAAVFHIDQMVVVRQ